VLEAAVAPSGSSFQWDVVEAGVDIMETAGSPLPPNVLESIRKHKVALKGPITTPIGTGFRSVNVALRKELDLYACIRPCKSYQGCARATKTLTS
jgi:isocitrate dehydrogenase (NAD+)